MSSKEPDAPFGLANILRNRLRNFMNSSISAISTAVGVRPATSVLPAPTMMYPRMEKEPARAIVP